MLACLHACLQRTRSQTARASTSIPVLRPHLERSVIWFISLSSPSFPGPVKRVCPHRRHTAPFIYLFFNKIWHSLLFVYFALFFFHLFNHSFSILLFRLFVLSYAHSFAHSFVRSFNCLLNRSCARTLSHCCAINYLIRNLHDARVVLLAVW